MLDSLRRRSAAGVALLSATGQRVPWRLGARAIKNRELALPPWDPRVHETPNYRHDLGPAGRALIERLDATDLGAIETLLDDEQRAELEQVDEAGRAYLTLCFGVGAELSVVLEKTGLRPDVPPAEVHFMGQRIPGGSVDGADFVLGALDRAGLELPREATGLDFGCSSGRVVRVLQAVRPHALWLGCDPNTPAIEWAREHLPGIEFFVNGQEPPLELESGSLDLAFAISIWSHFNEPASLVWLREMRRLLRPGGALVLTTAGPKAASVMPAWGFGDAGTRACWRGLNERGFFWFDSFGEAGDWGVKHEHWGAAYVTPEWLLARALPQWTLRLYEPGRLLDVQDLYVLQRP
jgi:SAM-dependent methyltransferase